jgi:hypothetical protein
MRLHALFCMRSTAPGVCMAGLTRDDDAGEMVAEATVRLYLAWFPEIACALTLRTKLFS